MASIERIGMAGDATSPETSVTPASVNTEAPLPQPAGPAGPSAVEQLGRVSKTGAWWSADFDPNRTDYQTKQEGHFFVYFDPKTGKEVARIPRVAGGAVDMPDWTEQEGERVRVSEFQQTLAQYELLSMINPGRLTPDQQAELQTLRDASRTEIINFKEQLEQEQHGSTILEHVRGAALEFLKRVRSARSHTRHGEENRDSVIRSGRQPAYYEEVVFEDSPELKQLQAKHGRLPTYIFEGIVQEVDKEANRRPSPPLNPLAEEEYTGVKRRRERERPREKKYTETPAYWGGRYYEFLWPESARDMIDSTLDWVKDRISEIGKRDVGTVNKLLEDIRGKVVELVESCRVRLNSDEWFLAENKEIIETDPDFLRAIAFGEGATDVLGNEKVTYKGNTEFGPQYKERFASEFIAHHDEIYLGNPKVARILHSLSRKGVNPNSRGGFDWSTYWLGHGWDVEKAEEGEIADYRKAIEEEIIEDAATHDLFTETIFASNKGLFQELIREKWDEENNFFELRDKYKLRFSFNDPLDRLLLDPNNQIRDRIVVTGNQQALARHDVRVGVFRRTREKLDVQDRLTGLTPEQRQQKIRLRIFQKMRQKTGFSYLAQRSKEDLGKLANARASNDIAAYDRILWKWVEDYNDYRIRMRLPRWYPSGWDRVSANIDRSTKVLDRALSEDEIEAMFEPIQLPQTFNYDDIDTRRNIEDARFGFQLARSYQIFLMQDTLLGGMRTRLVDPKTGEYVGRIPGDDETSLALRMIREKIDPQTGQVMRDTQGKVIYEVTDPNRKMARVFDIVQARLEIAIAKEAAVIEQAKAAKAAAIASGNQQAIKQTTENLRDILVNSQFLATHALKEIGLVDGKLPVWSYNFLDASTIHAFTKVLADYGVEVAPGVPISHNSKKEFYEIMERGRRALKAEHVRANQEFMVGTYPVFERDVDGQIIFEPELDKNGNPIIVNGQPRLVRRQAISLFTAASDWGDPGPINERERVVSKGAVAENRQVTETSYEISTSGGVVFTEAIPWAGDLGLYPLLVLLAVADIRGLHGYIKRRDEVEFHGHKFFDVKDAPQHARAQAAAYIARRALTGGSLPAEINGGKPTPGFLMEPFHGAFLIADFLYEHSTKLESYGMNNTRQYSLLAQQWRDSGYSYSNFPKRAELEKFRQLSYLEFDKMTKDMSDSLYKTEYEVLDYFQWALKAAKEVQTDRIGNAPRNWVEENTRKWYRFRRAIREAVQTGDRGFISRHGYAPEVANEISISMMEVVLQDADYLILRPYERARRVKEGVDILSRALTQQEIQMGFVIPDEKEWQNQPERIRLALENIRRRGLLEFMIEEGYELTDNQGKVTKVLGREIPVLVREQKVREDRSRQTLMLAGT